MAHELHITGDAEADALLTSDPLALLVGMLLDQQVPMETAFAGPGKLNDRLGKFDAKTIADYEPDAFADVMKQSPAVHRFPGSMAARVQALCAAVVADWGGKAQNIWEQGDPDGPQILKRLNALPGFGEQKAKIFLALLGKRRGLTATGWREASGAYGERDSYRSVADIVDPESLLKVRATKQAAKAAAKSKGGGGV